MSQQESPFHILNRSAPGLSPAAVCTPVAPGASADFHVVGSRSGPFLFVADGSRFYDARALEEAELRSIIAASSAGEVTRYLGLDPLAKRRIDGAIPHPPEVRSISLQVAQSCNLSCPYCYADEGRFGGKPRSMGLEVAKSTVDLLLAQSDPDGTLVLGYMGGEPLLNWPLIRELTPWAAERASALARRLRFSITTNGTLLRDDQAKLFAEYPFAVQLSVDGLGGDHDALRPSKDRSSSFRRILAALEAIERAGRPRSLTARATVTRLSADLPSMLDGLIELGFDDVGFGMAVTSPDARYTMRPEDAADLLGQMKRCGDRTLAEASRGRLYPFSNFTTALQQIHVGAARPYPCGAGAAYLSASSEGGLYACHRLIDAEDFQMGNVRDGLDSIRRQDHLAKSHVDRQEPCRSCWARYLCGGGCYHEVAQSGRVACDYIRGWLDYCLSAYADLDPPTLSLLTGRRDFAPQSAASFGGLLT